MNIVCFNCDYRSREGEKRQITYVFVKGMTIGRATNKVEEFGKRVIEDDLILYGI